MIFVLNVPFRDKDIAKSYGARWNAGTKHWFYEGETLPDGLKQWYPDAVTGPQDKIEPAAKPTVRSATSTADPVRPSANTEEAKDKYMSVTQVSALIQNTFNKTTTFHAVLVKGEVTNYSGPNRGNHYFDIKDDHSLLHCMLWADTARNKMNFELKKGVQVALLGDLVYYPPQGKASLQVTDISDIGEGAAALALKQLEKKLEAEGLFDENIKKPIPRHPKSIGIITSKDGQAIKDICKVAHQKDPFVQLVLYPVNVQGKNAVTTIVRGIRYMDSQGFDTLIVGRGGGSDEDLMAYNNEAIARAVYQAKTPIVSAVGHQGHWTIIDKAADLRVATPTDAADNCLPDVMADIRQLKHLQREMQVNMQTQVNRRKQALQIRQAQLEKNNPERRLREQQEALKNLEDRLHINMKNLFESKVHRLEVLTTRLNGLSPTAKLVKGFGYIAKDGQPLTTTEGLNAGDLLDIRIHDGTIHTTVNAVEQTEPWR